MNQFALALGLPETATEAEILAAIKALQDQAAQAAQELCNVKNKALEAEADAFVAEHQARIVNKDAVRAAFIANKEQTVALFGAIAAPAPVEKVCNKAVAKAPPGAAAPVKNTLAQYRAMPIGKDKRQFLREHAQELMSLENAEASDE